MTICRERTILTVLLLLPKPSCPSSGLVRNSRICLYPVVSQIARGLIPVRPTLFFLLPSLFCHYLSLNPIAPAFATQRMVPTWAPHEMMALVRNERYLETIPVRLTVSSVEMQSTDDRSPQTVQQSTIAQEKEKNKQTSPNVTELTNPNGDDGSLVTLGHTNPLSSCAICRVFFAWRASS